MTPKEALERAVECRRAGPRLYTRELHARTGRSLTTCYNRTIAAAIKKAWEDGYAAAKDEYK